MIVSNPSVFVPAAPTIDVSEARWAADQLATLIMKLGLDSPVSMVLRQARRELASLTPHTAPGGVVGPFRIAA